MEEKKFGPIIAHAPYTLNACSADAHTREFALQTMADDLLRMEYVPGNLYNFHPGSHVGQGPEEGIRLIAEALNDILRPEMHTTVLLETMAGKGSEVGRTFQELRAILDRVELSDKMGVCLDTCHVYDAGYDIVNDLEGVLREFDRCIGIEKLKALHLNDSKNPMGSHKDRHEKIGLGSIGEEAFRRIVRHPWRRPTNSPAMSGRSPCSVASAGGFESGPFWQCFPQLAELLFYVFWNPVGFQRFLDRSSPDVFIHAALLQAVKRFFGSLGAASSQYPGGAHFGIIARVAHRGRFLQYPGEMFLCEKMVHQHDKAEAQGEFFLRGQAFPEKRQVCLRVPGGFFHRGTHAVAYGPISDLGQKGPQPLDPFFWRQRAPGQDKALQHGFLEIFTGIFLEKLLPVAFKDTGCQLSQLRKADTQHGPCVRNQAGGKFFIFLFGQGKKSLTDFL